MKLAAIMCSVVLGCGMAIAQEQSSGTVNTLSVDPQQNQKLSGSMGTETGQPNDVSRGADRKSQLGNPSSRPISGQQSDKASQNRQDNKLKTSGSPAANQRSASTNSGKAPRRKDNRDNSGPQ
jgi:hypothetical protein